jgi:DNA-binding XRE family transcriptional regulator
MIMPKKALPRIVSVAPRKRSLTLRVRWNTGDDTLIDVSGLINSFRLYAPLRNNPDLFGKVRVGEHGTDIVWGDELDISNDTLWRLAQEQSGATISAEAFRRWRESRGFTLNAAAKALGVSRRMIAYYEKGDRPIPRVVALATRGLEAAE